MPSPSHRRRTSGPPAPPASSTPVSRWGGAPARPVRKSSHLAFAVLACAFLASSLPSCATTLDATMHATTPSDLQFHLTHDHNSLQTVWYHHGIPVGILRNPEALSALTPSDPITITLHQTASPSTTEVHAAVNALLRSTLTLLLQYNTIAAIEVPSGTFPSILQELTYAHFQITTPDSPPPPSAKVVLKLHTASGDTRLAYLP